MALSNTKFGGISGTQCLLYINFIVKKKYRVDTIAQIMKIHPDTLYKYIRGERDFPIDRLADLVNATGDSEYLEYHANACGYVLMPKIKNRKTIEILGQMAKLMLTATDQDAENFYQDSESNFGRQNRASESNAKFLRRQQARQAESAGEERQT